VATAGVAAVAALEVVSRGEDHVRTFVIKILGAKLVALALYVLFSGCVFVEFDWLRHWLRPSLGFVIDALWARARYSSFTPFQFARPSRGYPLPPLLGDKSLYYELFTEG
jgi:hypothetical protein